MPRVCTVCAHPQRAEIDSALVAGGAIRAIARQYSLGRDSIARHQSDHLPAALALAQGAVQVAQADDLLSQVRGLHRRALAILATAEAQGDLKVALAAIREARGNLELLAKLLGELDERPQINLVMAPEWIAIRAAILMALSAYPEARTAVAERLASVEAA
jgi:hypothetical protein